MIEIKIPQDIRSYQEKVVKGLSLRQLISVVLLLLINVPLYLFGAKYVGKDLVSYIMLITSAPLVMIGFFKYNKMNFEEVILAAIQSKFIQPTKRKYEINNLIQFVDDYILKEEFEPKKKNKNKKGMSNK